MSRRLRTLTVTLFAIGCLLPAGTVHAAGPGGTEDAGAIGCPAGSTPLRATGRSAVKGGGELATFADAEGRPVEMGAPPAGFDPLTASPADLDRFGLPQRPAGGAEAAGWTRFFTGYRPAPIAAPCASDRVVAAPAGDLSGVAGSSTSGNWSGYVARTSSLFTAVQGQFRVPKTVAGCNGTQASWVGLGGYLSGGLIQAGVNADYPNGRPMAWYEYLRALGPGSVPEQFIPGVPFKQGHTAYAYVDFDTDKGWAHFIVKNVSTGVTSGTLVKALGSGFYDGRTADFISERLSFGGQLSPISRHEPANFMLGQVRTPDNRWHGIGTVTSDRVTMASSRVLEQPTAFTNTSSFSSHWVACG